MYTSCAFDCFSDTYCIDRTLVCDRYKNCPNGVDEANCEYSKYIHFYFNIQSFIHLGHHHQPLSFQSKIILFIVLLIIISLALSSILICYFCCEVTNNNNDNNHHLSFTNKERKSSM